MCLDNKFVCGESPKGRGGLGSAFLLPTGLILFLPRLLDSSSSGDVEPGLCVPVQYIMALPQFQYEMGVNIGHFGTQPARIEVHEWRAKYVRYVKEKARAKRKDDTKVVPPLQMAILLN